MLDELESTIQPRRSRACATSSSSCCRPCSTTTGCRRPCAPTSTRSRTTATRSTGSTTSSATQPASRGAADPLPHRPGSAHEHPQALGAATVAVRLIELDGGFCVRVIDDGIGFDCNGLASARSATSGSPACASAPRSPAAGCVSRAVRAPARRSNAGSRPGTPASDVPGRGGLGIATTRRPRTGPRTGKNKSRVPPGLRANM